MEKAEEQGLVAKKGGEVSQNLEYLLIGDTDLTRVTGDLIGREAGRIQGINQ